jgi:dTDP-L-rhamnose 4-epimerase
MRVLVTGGAGFIGRQLVPILLDRGHEVTILDSLEVKIHGGKPDLPARLSEDARLVVGDVRDPTAWGMLDATRPEVVVHLAAETGVGQSMYEIGRYTDVNVHGTAVMLDALRERNGGIGRLVLASSRAVYGEGAYSCETCGSVTPSPRTPERLDAGLWEPVCPGCGGDVESVPTGEETPRAPTSVYAMTKAAQEDLVAVAGPTLGASTAVLRYTNVYGEGQPLTNPYTGVLSAFGLRLVEGQEPNVYEDGEPSRDFVHVSDVARATASAVEAEGDVVANVGSGERWTLEEIARRLSQVFGRDGSVHVTGQFRLGDIRHFVADQRRARAALDFAPALPLDTGLERFGRWVMEEAERPTEDVAREAERALANRGLLGQARPGTPIGHPSSR